MAGYFSKLMGDVYEGSYVATADIKNGVFAVISSGKVAASAADSSVELRMKEKTNIGELNAIRFEVVKAGSEVFMTENLFTRDENLAYDDTDYTVKAGELVRMKRLVPGDELVISVTSEIFAAFAVNDVYNIAANGLIVKKS